MKKTALLLVSALTFSAGAFAQTAAEIVEKHIAAVGGMDKVSAVKSAQYEQSMSLMGMDLTGKTSIVVGQSSRADVSAMGSEIITVVDGDKGWSINPLQGASTATALPADQVAMQKGNTEVTGLQLAYAKARNYPVELVGKEQMGGKDVYNLKVTRPEMAVNYYVDAATYQVTGTKANTPAGEVKINFSNFKTQDGLTLPFTMEINSPAMPGAITMNVTKLTFNNTIDPAIFAMPK